MTSEQCQQDQQTADRATVFCLISLIFGAYIIWANLDQAASPDTASTLFPVAVIGVVHLVGGGIAIYHARNTKKILRNLHVYGYFFAAAALAAWLLISGNLLL